MRVKDLKLALDDYGDNMVVQIEDTNEEWGTLYDFEIDNRTVTDEDGDAVSGVVIRRAEKSLRIS